MVPSNCTILSRAPVAKLSYEGHYPINHRFALSLWYHQQSKVRCQNIENALVPPCYQIAPSYRKMSQYPHAIKLLHHTEKCVISNKAINIHSRGPKEQFSCVLEPHRGCLHKVKKVSWYPLIKKGQRSHKCAF